MRTGRSISLALIGLFSVSALHAAALTDVSGSTYETAIDGLLKRGIVEGYADLTFRPSASINRAEFLTILMNTRYGTTKQPNDLRCFKDLETKTPQWYARPVCLARELGVVEGYQDPKGDPSGWTFKPEKPVNFAEAMKMSLLSFGILVAPTSDEWYEPYLNEARNRNILPELLQKPGAFLTRGQMASIAYSLVLADEREEEDPSPASGNAVCGNGIQEELEQCDDHNVQDSDGCSSICILVPEPVRRAFLGIRQDASGVVSNVAQGQKGVPLLKFSAVSNRQDVLLTSLTFTPSVGSLQYAQHYTLSMDRNGDGIFESVVEGDGRVDKDRLIFEHMKDGGVTLPKNLHVPFQVSADLASTLGPVSIGLEFAMNLPDYIEAQGAVDGFGLTGIETNGTCTAADCFIRVDTLSASNIAVQTRGNLFVTEDTVPTRSHILLGGSLTDTLLKLRLRSESENIDVKTIRIDSVPASIDALQLYRVLPGQSFNPLTAQPFAQATSGQCTNQPSTRFCAVLPLSTLVVSPSQEIHVYVTARMKTDAVGGISGQQVALSVSSTTGDSHAIDARGISSQQELAQNDGNGVASGEIFIGQSSAATNMQITGKTSDTSFASIGSIRNDGVSEEFFIPTGNAAFGSFRFTALAHGNSFQGSRDTVFKTIVFHVNASNVQLDPAGFRLSTKENQSQYSFCSAASTTGSFDVTCSNIDGDAQIQSHLSQGESLTYRLTGNITNPSLSTGQSTLYTELATLGQRGQTNSVTWSDETTTFTWVDVPETSVRGTVYRNN